jgi:hypothetical protein
MNCLFGINSYYSFIFCTNLFIFQLILHRWLIRSAYSIPGDTCADCYTSVFCPCCEFTRPLIIDVSKITCFIFVVRVSLGVANQAYQTAKERGAPVDNGGRYTNVNQFVTPLPPPTATVQNYMYSCCCMPCAVGDIMERSVSMPWYLGCCCVNVWTARNLMRYQYRIQGNDVLEELAAPCGAHFVTNIVQQCVPCAGCVLWAAYATLVTQLGLESTAHAPSRGPYLSGSTAPALPPPGASGAVAVAPIAMIHSPMTQQNVQMGTLSGPPPPSAIQVYTHNEPIVGHAVPMHTGSSGYGRVSTEEPVKKNY